jgi:hypothetical protein
MDREYYMCRCDENCIQNFGQNLGADERIILKPFLKKQGVIVCIGFVFTGTGTSCGLL